MVILKTVSAFHKQWAIYRRSYENALKIALKESFGKKGLNTIARKTENDLILSNGFYVTDNIVHVIFKDMYLKELPHLKAPDVTFHLAHNVLILDAELTKMIVETEYSLMRNSTEVLFTGSVQDPYKNSPFILQQVQNEGHAAIIAEGCILRGFAISTLSGQSVVLGHDTFRVRDCKFNVEISAAGLGSPPVIAPYFSNEQRNSLENLISKPIRSELMTKMQSAMFTYVNTSIFNDLAKYRYKQEKIFEKSRKYINEFIRKNNKETVVGNKASQDLPPMKIQWTVNVAGEINESLVALTDVVVDGFDSIYSPYIGGPYKLQNVGIAETLRYNTLKVHGQLTTENNNVTNAVMFYMELQDVSVNLEMNSEYSSPATFNIDNNIFWRHTDFSIRNLKDLKERITAESIISGYVINQIPKSFKKILLKATNSGKHIKSEEMDGKKTEHIEENSGFNNSVKNENGPFSNEGDSDSNSKGNKKMKIHIHVKKQKIQNVTPQKLDNKQKLYSTEDKDISQTSLISGEDNIKKELKAMAASESAVSGDDDGAPTKIVSENIRRSRKTKNKKRGRKSKKRHNKRHRGRKVNSHHRKVKKNVNKKVLKRRYTEMPIYVSENEV
ncbi:uncharacterized protein [Battus philenor]|uniref:uncharacterized protein n=1 Tax=Battus philenor TaxID=42288 RepID=UPI0035D04976